LFSLAENFCRRAKFYNADSLASVSVFGQAEESDHQHRVRQVATLPWHREGAGQTWSGKFIRMVWQYRLRLRDDLEEDVCSVAGTTAVSADFRSQAIVVSRNFSDRPCRGFLRYPGLLQTLKIRRYQPHQQHLP
jgi:hypothetical protein